MEVFGSSGTRGVANETLTPTFALGVARAAGTVWDTDRVTLGRDTRTTGPMLADAVASGLASVGTDVDRLGIVPTPALQAHAASEGIPGVMVTASHNPPEYNGIKLVGADGSDLDPGTLADVESALASEDPRAARWDEVGTVRWVDTARRDYIEGVLAAVDRDRIADAELTVALDPGHGAGSLTSPELFRELGCRVLTVNAQPDGHFPGRNPEPVEGNLADLMRLVRTTDADVGVAHDGDADRAIFVDEDGTYLEGDATLAALAAAALEEGDVVISAVNVSQRLVDATEAAGATLDLTPIGSTYIVDRIRERRAAGEAVPIAGEGNGGVVYPDHLLARDGAYTAARFLELLADRSASAIAADHAGYYNVRQNVEYERDDERERMLEAITAFAEDADAEVTTVDGHRLDYGDAWVLARPSGTEPLVRIYAEARTPDRAEELASQLTTAVRES